MWSGTILIVVLHHILSINGQFSISQHAFMKSFFMPAIKNKIIKIIRLANWYFFIKTILCRNISNISVKKCACIVNSVEIRAGNLTC